MAPSICVHCGLGCNTTVGERYGSLRRVVNRYNHEVNGYFLCDRGRFGYEFVESTSAHRSSARSTATPPLKSEALERPRRDSSAKAMPSALDRHEPRSKRNFALRALVGPDRFFAGIPDDELAALVAPCSASCAKARRGPHRSMR